MKLGLYDRGAKRYYPIQSSHVRIGSHPSSQVVLDHAGVAPIHAEIHITDVGIELHHKAEDGRTLVNNFPAFRCYLSSRDIIAFGDLVLEFLIGQKDLSPHLESRDQAEASRFDEDKTMMMTRRPQKLATGRRRHTSSSQINDPNQLLNNLEEKPDADTKALERIEGLTPIEVIAQGAQGTIHKAEYKGQTVAVKQIKLDVRERARERFQRECMVMRTLQHPSLVRLIDSVEEENKAFLIMEYIGGDSLEAILEKKTALPAKDALRYALHVAEGIEYLSKHSIIHRDIKPSNILLDEEDRARLVDFGLVRFMLIQDLLTAPGQLVGSPSYMSPEQVRARELTPKSDVFSLGVTLFEMICGRRPFLGAKAIELFTAILEEKPPYEHIEQSGCGGLVPLLEKLLAKKPSARPSPEETVALLQEACEGSARPAGE